MLLGDLGAEVVKIEPFEGDGTRRLRPFANGEAGPDRSAYFLAYNRNKLGLAINLKKPEGRDIVLRLAALSDVAMENFTPGVLDRLGLGFAALGARNPGLILCSISGFGQTGPYAHRPSYDGNAQAMGGICSINGEPGGEPLRVANSIGDVGTAVFAALAVVSALYARVTTGRGQRIDLAQRDCVFAMLEDAPMLALFAGEVRQRMGNCHPSIEPYDLYPCKDGHVFFAGYNDGHWRRTCERFGRPDLATDPRTADRQARGAHYESLVRPTLLGWFSGYTKRELERIFDEIRVPCSPVLDVGECVADPTLAERGLIFEQDHPVAGRVRLPSANPLRFSDTPWSVRLPAPILGSGTQRILGDLLGYSAAEIGQLKADGVILERAGAP
jgi:crotonobetainyl-CoA:carnitine CoA-transferase CaiB-like acyl-CoA transferase